MAQQGTPYRRFRMDDEMWRRFKDAVAAGDPELDRSKVLRQLVRWYIGDTDEPPRRPEPKRSDPNPQAGNSS